MIRRYREIGVDEVILFAFVEDESALKETIEAFAATIVEPARSLWAWS